MCFSLCLFVLYLLNVLFSISSFKNIVQLICWKASPNNTGEGRVPATEQWCWWKQWKQLTKTCWICMILFFFFSFYFLIKLTFLFICASYWLFIYFRQWDIEDTRMFNLFWTLQWPKQMSLASELWTQLLLKLSGETSPW